MFTGDETPVLRDEASRQDTRPPQSAQGPAHVVDASVLEPPEPTEDRAAVEDLPDIEASESLPGQNGADLVPRREFDEWRDRAVRLQADMDNYRRRRRLLAQEEIKAERQRLLRGYVSVIDDLDRALSVTEGGSAGLRHGIELTRRGALQFLQKEGVEKIEAQGQAFDPAWHEAVATVDGSGLAGNRDTVVRVIESGYRLGDELLRPAKVVVAV
jgi:molecular chaperone GrpE